MSRIHVIHHAPLLPEILWKTLPAYLSDAVQSCGAKRVEELRLYRNRRVWVHASDQSFPLDVILGEEQLRSILLSLCHGSLYAHIDTIREGYLSPGEGIRVGVAGSAAVEDGKIVGVGEIDGLVIRIPHPVRVNANELLSRLFDSGQVGSLLVFSPPGVGKTTMLRAIAEGAASAPHCKQTVLVDTRCELREGLNATFLTLQTLSGYPREVGIEIAVRSLGAELIVCDEIGGDADAKAILSAANCGVPLAASAHASSIGELLARPALLSLHRARIFSTYALLSRKGSQLSCTTYSWQEAETVRGGEHGGV